MARPTPPERLEHTLAVRFVFRAGQMLLVILAVVTITFFVLRVATGDPARLVNPPGTPEDVVTQTRERLGTDRPLISLPPEPPRRLASVSQARSPSRGRARECRRRGSGAREPH